MAVQRRITIVAGPNGAGKTTFAAEYLAHEAACAVYLNADLIAQGLNPLDPAAAALPAGRAMIAAIRNCAARGESFTFETTLSGRGWARAIPGWRARRFQVALVFLSLPSADAAVARVRRRAAEGGHTVPEADIRRRFHAGLRNFHRVYRSLVDEWMLYDNAGARPVLLEEGKRP